ncbi:transporter substrate-binding domain-containing protein [Thalassotalea profundi]|uniref:Solute-binding protein family 3/N-terminal domain-containing protein n=1 Tax=Thalassotalea profundi TaxID=2036687 RepID=A0ABQ3IKN5_9GAMM|nr:transporter substrate-binding domain-containing protein [Thalassotalea profundi]GHE84861.1 hypothetical protein GCM10011501_12160 [Thalassotalea profundi]
MKGGFFTLLIGMISFFCYSSEQIKLMAYDIPAILQADKQGEYDLVIEQVRQLQQEKWFYTVAPPARVDKMFEQKVVDCILPFDKAFHPNKNTINSVPLNIAKARIYSISGQFESLNALVGKKVGARTGMLYGPEFDSLNLDVKLVGHIDQNIEKLLSQRIDAFVAWSPDIDAALNKKGLTFIRSDAFIVHNEAFLCHDTPIARSFIETFNKGMSQIKSEVQSD